MRNFIYGFHAIEEFLKKSQACGKLLVAGRNDRILHLMELAREKQLQVIRVKEPELDTYCKQEQHKGIILIPEAGNRQQKTDFMTPVRNITRANPLVLLLDEITDPHNYGAILRSADQFYVDLVVSTERKAARETDAVAAVSAGANVYVEKATVTNLMHVIDFLKKEGYWIFGADMDGKPAHTADFKGKTALVLGSEGRGIRRLVRENCDFLVKIPAQGHVDSFNVSVAAGILMYEIRRQQGFV